MLTVQCLLALTAFVLVILSATTARVPLWVGTLVLCIIELLRAIPLGG